MKESEGGRGSILEQDELVSGEKTLSEVRLVTDSQVGWRLEEECACACTCTCAGCEEKMEGF